MCNLSNTRSIETRIQNACVTAVNNSVNNLSQFKEILGIGLYLELHHSLRPSGTQDMGYIFLVKYINVYPQQFTLLHTRINLNLHNLNLFYHILA